MGSVLTLLSLSELFGALPSTLSGVLFKYGPTGRRELRGVLRDRESAVNTLLDLKRGGITEKEHAQQEGGSEEEPAKPTPAVHGGSQEGEWVYTEPMPRAKMEIPANYHFVTIENPR